MSSFPFEDPVVVVRVTGEAILHALENSVCKYPALEGRFPQVSNIKFEFDPNLHPGSRVKWVKINNADLEPSKKYKLSTRGYMARGKDGYDSLLVQSEGGDAEELVNEENGVLISTILRQYFMSLRVIGKWKFWSPSLERQWDDINTSMQQSCSILQPKFPSSMAGKEPPSGSAAQSTANGIGRGDCDGEETPFEEESDDDEQPVSPVSPQVSRKIREVELIRKVMNKWWRLAGVNGNPTVCDEQREEELNVNWTKVSSEFNIENVTPSTHSNHTVCARLHLTFLVGGIKINANAMLKLFSGHCTKAGGKNSHHQHRVQLRLSGEKGLEDQRA